MEKLKEKFSPLIFLASLGAGGIAIMPFAFLQYTLNHGTGLVTRSDILHGKLGFLPEVWFSSLELIMIAFVIIHFVLTFIFFKKMFSWWGSEDRQRILNSPLENASLLAPFISVIMTMNVFIGPIRYFIPAFSSNLQLFMGPALVVWLVIWLALVLFEIKLLKISFSKGFDIDKISFGWLLHPFALGMLTVVGTGIAAMANNYSLAATAAFFSMISGSMGLFLLLVKLIVIFKSHFNSDSLPEKKFLPSFLIVIPNITLYSISAFRLGHFLEHSLGFEMGAYYFFVIVLPFAFEVWYLMFGISLLSRYFKKHLWEKEFYVTQWGLICPFVAFGVLGSFVYEVFLPYSVLYILIGFVMFFTIFLFLMFLMRYIKCSTRKETGLLDGKAINCSS